MQISTAYFIEEYNIKSHEHKKTVKKEWKRLEDAHICFPAGSNL